MAVKTLKYSVSADGINPSFERNAGTQYDHKKTQIQFALEQSFYDSLISELKDGTIHYRFDCYDGENVLHQSEYKTLTGMALEPYVLEYWVTKFGGKIRVCLVITISKDGYTDTQVFESGVTLYLKNLPETSCVKEKYQGFTTLADNAKNNADKALEAMNSANKALNEIKELRLALENAEWVFDGTDGENEIDINFIVESDFDSDSKNALSNGTITKKFAELENNLNGLKEEFTWQTIDELAEAIKDKVFLEAHPIGSYYWSSDPTSPESLFGGNWKQIKDVFVLAAGENYSAESTGGESEHKLSMDEMPKHTHMFNPEAGFDGINFVVPTKTSGTSGSSISENGNAHAPGHWASATWGTYPMGSDQAHNNMPPYITAYCWQRINDGEDE
ncbi:MAG: hypothetical protein U0L33_05955 [Acutalibacteraceae bacterium]|nr:hypothetical protein [Acutalibacteraceae bacterium]